MEKLTITLAQINVDPNQPQKNMDKVERIIQNLASNQLTLPPHLLLLPELWSTGFTPDLQVAADQNKEIIENLIRLSNKFQIIIGGSYIQRNTHRDYTNTLKLILPGIELIPTYDKIHLFSQMNEIDWFQPGKSPSIVNYKNHIIALTICYDLRFPELFRNYSNHQADLCLLPAQWPSKRIDHFTKLIQARAIENQFFFAAVNTVGKIGNTFFGGSSTLIDPLGNPLAQLSNKDEEVRSLTIDLASVKQYRADFPVLSDQTKTDFFPPQSFST